MAHHINSNSSHTQEESAYHLLHQDTSWHNEGIGETINSRCHILNCDEGRLKLSHALDDLLTLAVPMQYLGGPL